jgi:hypothetical protein
MRLALPRLVSLQGAAAEAKSAVFDLYLGDMTLALPRID